MPVLSPLFDRILPHLPPVSRAEQARSAAGGLIGVALVGLVGALTGPSHGLSPLVPPMGASAVLLFAVPASPLAQPWSVLIGNVVAAVVGVACARFIPSTTLAAGVAVGIAIAAMFALRCLHPPSGAIALTAVLGGETVHAAGFGFVVWPVAAGSLALVVVAIAYNRLVGRSYPHVAHRPPAAAPPPAPPAGPVVRPDDVTTVLKRHDAVIDVDTDDLVDLVLEAEAEASDRLRAEGGPAGADGEDLAAAVDLLRRHGIAARPVVDRGGRVVGIVRDADGRDRSATAAD